MAVINPIFRLEVSYSDTTGDPVATYLRVHGGKASRTTEISEGLVFADYSTDGQLLGIDLLGPCRVEVLDRVAPSEPQPVRHFLREGDRKEMIHA